MTALAVTIQRHRLISLLIPAVGAQGMVMTIDAYERVKNLLELIPPDQDILSLKAILCPVFATTPQQQSTFNSIFDNLIQSLEIDLEPKKTSTDADTPFKDDKFHKSPLDPEPIKPTQTSTNRPLAAQLEECTDPPYSWDIFSEDIPLNIDLNYGQSFNQTLQKLRQREQNNNQKIDLLASIHATIRRGGFPDFQYQQLTRPPEYLMLVERQAHNDHRAKSFDQIYQLLRRNLIFVERFFNNGDLRINRNEKYPAGLALTDLRGKFAEARLIVLGTGNKLINPNTGKLANWASTLMHWKPRVFLTTTPRQLWTRRENILEQVFTLLPVSLASLRYIAEAGASTTSVKFRALPLPMRQIIDVRVLELNDGEVISGLQKHFDDAMLCWIASCAIYPALNYHLTLQLGHLLANNFYPNLLTAENLLSLSKIPWFIQGRISPKEARNELLKYLDHQHPEKKELVLKYLHHLMLQKIGEGHAPPTNSAAAAAFNFNLALFKTKTDQELSAELLNELRVVIKRLNRQTLLEDFVLPAALEEIVENLTEEQVISEEAQIVESATWLFSEGSVYHKDKRYDIYSVDLLYDMATYLDTNKNATFDQSLSKTIFQVSSFLSSLRSFEDAQSFVDLFISVYETNPAFASDSLVLDIIELSCAGLYQRDTKGLIKEFLNKIRSAKEKSSKDAPLESILIWKGIAQILENFEFLDQALEVVLYVLNLQNKYLNIDHQDIGETYSQLAGIYQKAGNLVEAKNYLQKTIALFKKTQPASQLLSEATETLNQISSLEFQPDIKDSKPKVFLCYALEEHDKLFEDFVVKFQNHNEDYFELLYDKQPHSGNMHERFQTFARECDIALLLVSTRFTLSSSYTSQYELPILLERQQAREVAIVGIRFIDGNYKEWNQTGEVYFFQVKYKEINPSSSKYLKNEYAVYEKIRDKDRNSFHKKLKEWLDATYETLLSEKLKIGLAKKIVLKEEKMAGFKWNTKLSARIERYKQEAGKLERQEHIRRLQSISEALLDTVPSEVTEQELKNLEHALGNFKKALYNDENIKDNQILALNSFIAKVSYLSLKKPSNRTEKMNLDILNLGSQLFNLALILS